MAFTPVSRTSKLEILTQTTFGTDERPPAPDAKAIRFLDLPYEVRQLIYREVFTINPNTTLSHAAHPPSLHMIRQLPSMSVLLVCRQIYNEARFMPLRCNTFDFFRWYGSNVFECRQFIRNLQPWQVSQLRNIQLAITEADLKGPDADVRRTSDAECTLLDVCDAVGPYIRSLDLDISVIFDKNFDWQAAASFWLPHGLANFTDLRSLQITIGKRIAVKSDAVEIFREQISRMLPKCLNISVRSLQLEAEKMEAEREAKQVSAASQNGSVPPKFIEVHQTFIVV